MKQVAAKLGSGKSVLTYVSYVNEVNEQKILPAKYTYLSGEPFLTKGLEVCAIICFGWWKHHVYEDLCNNKYTRCFRKPKQSCMYFFVVWDWVPVDISFISFQGLFVLERCSYVLEFRKVSVLIRGSTRYIKALFSLQAWFFPWDTYEV